MPSLLMPSVTPTFTVPKFQKTDTFQQEKPAIGGYFKTPTLNQDVFQPTATPPASSQVRSGFGPRSFDSLTFELNRLCNQFRHSNLQIREAILKEMKILADELEIVSLCVEDLAQVEYYDTWLAAHTTTQQ
jgi:hypothetical protein